MASILPVFLVLVIIAALMTASALFVPKGPNHELVSVALRRVRRTHDLQSDTNWTHDCARGLLFNVDGDIYGAAAPASW